MKIKIFNIRLTKEHFERDQEIVNDFLQRVRMAKSSTHLIEGKPNYWSIVVYYDETFSKDEKRERIAKRKAIESESELDEKELEIVKIFKRWRLVVSELEGVPSYRVISNKDIYSLAKYKPTNLQSLYLISGFGPYKVSVYGDEIISILESEIEKNNLPPSDFDEYDPISSKTIELQR